MYGKRGRALKERSATCKACGLIGRNQSELDNHISYAHRGTASSPSVKSSEQKKHPFP
jgi:hypothetical protein